MRGNNASIRRNVLAQLSRLGKPWRGYVGYKPDPNKFVAHENKSTPLTVEQATDVIVKHISQGHDTYVTLASFAPDAPGQARNKAYPEGARNSRVVWADYDAANGDGKPNPIAFPLHLFDRDDDRCIPELADAVELVESGRPGNYQPRIHLAKPVTAKFVARLNHAFKVLVGGDTKWMSNTYLRVIGSPNTRPGAHRARRVQDVHTPLASGAKLKELLNKALAEVGREYDWDQPLKAVSTQRAVLILEPISNTRRREILRLLSKDPMCRQYGIRARLNTGSFIDGYEGDRSSLFAGLYKDLHRVGLSIEEAYAFLEPLSESFVDAQGRPKLERHVRSQWPNEQPKPKKPVQVSKVSSDPSPRGRLKLTRLSEIKMKNVQWLWEDRIPLHELSLIAGPEGVGKSTILSHLMARITQGEMPGQFLGQPRDVIFMTSEGNWNTTIVPRFAAAGADLNRVTRMDPVAEGHTGIFFDEDIDAIEEVIRDNRVALLVVDPIVSALGDSVDDSKPKALRASLEQISTMATRADCAILGVAHHKKGDSNDPSEKLSGLKVWQQVTRAVLTVVHHPEREGRPSSFVLGQTKNNLAALAPDLEGDIVTAFVSQGREQIKTSRIEGDLVESEYSIRQAMKPDASSHKDDQVTQWLINELSGREVLKNDLIERSTAPKRTLERRFKEMRGQSRQTRDGAYWSLLGFSTEEVEDL